MPRSRCRRRGRLPPRRPGERPGRRARIRPRWRPSRSFRSARAPARSHRSGRTRISPACCRSGRRAGRSRLSRRGSAKGWIRTRARPPRTRCRHRDGSLRTCRRRRRRRCRRWLRLPRMRRRWLPVPAHAPPAAAAFGSGYPPAAAIAPPIPLAPVESASSLSAVRREHVQTAAMMAVPPQHEALPFQGAPGHGAHGAPSHCARDGDAVHRRRDGDGRAVVARARTAALAAASTCAVPHRFVEARCPRR